MYDKHRKKGFTLIELLVVIAIIGILSSFILIEYPKTKQRFRDARTITSMSQFRTQADILYRTKGDYADVKCAIVAGVCTCPDNDIEVLCNDVRQNSKEDPVINVNDNDDGFCAVAHLKSDNEYFCIDSMLRAKKYPVPPTDCESDCILANDCRCAP